MERWEEIQKAFQEAVTLTADERETYLRQLSARSAKIYQEVEALLHSHEAAPNSFLNTPAFAHEELTAAAALDETQDYVPAGDETIDLPEAPEDVYRTVGSSPSIGTAPEFSSIGEIGDYQLIAQIGRGGMGVVYKAYHTKLRRMVALKIIASGNICAPEDIARFHVEAEAAARLDHPGIVPVYEVGEHDGTHFYSMAYVEGQSLSEFVGENSPRLGVRQAAKLMEEVCLAVQYAHDRAVIHRDLKPANILLDKDGHPRLTDFGLAKVTQEEEGLTMTGQVMGTPSYMAPEQALGQQDQMSTRTDVYSLGATLYALLAGQPPFKGQTLIETLRQVQSSAPPPLTGKETNVPVDLWTICEKCLAKESNDRYVSAGAVADDLRCYLNGFPISARPAGRWLRTVRWCQRNKVVAGLLGATATALLLGLVFSTFFWLQAAYNLALSEQTASNLTEALVTITETSEKVLADQPGTQHARATLLGVAQKYYQELSENEQASPEEVAEAYLQLARVQMWLDEFEKAAQSFANALTMQNEAISMAEDEFSAFSKLGKIHNDYATLGEKMWNSASLADITAETQKKGLEIWQEHAKQSVLWRQRAADLKPEDHEILRLLANAKMNLGYAILEAAAESADESRFGEANKLFEQAQTLRVEILNQAPALHEFERDLAKGYGGLADVLEARADIEGDPALEAELWKQSHNYRKQASEILEDLPAEWVDREILATLATSYQLRGNSSYSLGNVEQAIEEYQRMHQKLRQLVRQNPTVFTYRRRLADAQFNLIQLLLYQGDVGGYDYIVPLFTTLADTIAVDPTNQEACNLLLDYTSWLAESLARENLEDVANNYLDQAIEMLEELTTYSAENEAIQSTIDALRKKKEEINTIEATEDPTV